jgi:hypothetical protein
MITPLVDKAAKIFRETNGDLIPAEEARDIEMKLQDAHAFIDLICKKLGAEKESDLLTVLDEMLGDARIGQLIRQYGLCVQHSHPKAKVEKGEEWAAQDDRYSELFERPTLREAVESLVAKLEKRKTGEKGADNPEGAIEQRNLNG